MSEFGAQCMVLPLRKVMVRAPSPAFADVDPALWHYDGRPDYLSMQQAHQQFVQILQNHGSQVMWLEQAADDLLDSMFTHDPSLVTEAGALILSMGKDLRVSETDAHDEFYRHQGVPILGRIKPPGRVEAGDCLWLNQQTLLVGRGFRSNQAGINQLAEYLSLLSVKVYAFDLPYGQGASACLHLMSLISMLDHDLAIVHAPLLPVSLHQMLSTHGIELIDCNAEEFATSKGISVNVLALAPRELVMVDAFPRTRAQLEAAGCTVQTFPGDDLCLRCEGGPTCLTRPVQRQMAAGPSAAM